MCHWWSSLLVKVKIHNSIDGANDVPGYFYLNWDIVVKWNAFKITSVMSSYICPGFNVLWWHHAVDTPSTVRWMDINSLTDSMTEVSSLIRWQIYSHHHLQHTLKYLHSLLSILPISSAIFTHLHCSTYTIVPMPMKQPWMIWVYKPQESSRTHKSNQTKHTKKSCAYFTGILRHRSLQLRNSAPETDSIFCQMVPKIAGNNTYCLALIKLIYRSDSYQPLECWSRTLTEHIHQIDVG